MCRCTPAIRTPFCGRGNCHWPKPEGTRQEPPAVVVPAPPAPPAAPWACRCPETHPYRCPVCEVRWLEGKLDAAVDENVALHAHLAAAEAEVVALKASLPGINVRHLLTE